MTPSLISTRSIAALIACAFTASATAQTTATTDPVGFITLNVAGTGGTLASQLSFEGLSLTTPVVYQGSAETVGASSLTDNEATWTDDQFNDAAGQFYAEITSGTAAGTTYNISDTIAATKTVTLSEPLAAGVAAGATFKIRKHWTIGTVFGPANEAGLQGGTSSTADLILIYNGATYDTYFYSTGGLPGVGWRKVGGAAANQVNTKINQDDGVIVQRKQSSNLGVILMGAVKTGQSSIPVFNGLNFVGNVYAANMTLGSSGLYTGSGATGVTPGTSSTADTVQTYNSATSTYETYFYSSGGLPGVGWRKVGGAGADQSNVPLPVGTSVIVNRKAVAGFNWIAPQHPTTL
jgi:uncharacterized protein (TIGR02597 family)